MGDRPLVGGIRVNFRLIIIAGVLATSVLAGAQGAKGGGAGFGQRGPGGPGGPGGQGGQRRMSLDDRLKRMAKDLNLTPAQQKKLKPIMEAGAKKGKEIFENKKLTDQQKGDAFKKLRDENRKKIEAILTPDQKKKYEEMRKQRMNRGPGGPGGFGQRGPGGPGAGGPPKGGGKGKGG